LPSTFPVLTSRAAYSESEQEQIQGWAKQWQQGPASIGQNWFAAESPIFSLLQYEQLTEDQLRDIVAHLPRGMRLRWPFQEAGRISPPVSTAKQDEAYERVRAVAERHGIVLEKGNVP